MKDIVCIIVICASLAFLVFQFYLLYRNKYVCDYRVRIAENNPPEDYERLPSYGTMYWQLFRWDWSDYLKGED